MTYQNVDFPSLKLKHDFVEENLAPTTVISNFAKEYRINRFSTPKRRFKFPARNMKAADWTTILAFLTSVGFQRDSFNLVHPFTGSIIKVRLDGVPQTRAVSISSAGAPVIVEMSDINLIEVFNE